MDILLAEKLADKNLAENVTNPLTLHLRTGMTAFAGVEGKFNFENQNIKLAMRVVRKRLNEVKYSVIED